MSDDETLRAKEEERAELCELIEEHESGRMIRGPDTGANLAEWRARVRLLDCEIAALRARA